MGAIVQILAANSVVRATTYTDMQGRYLVRSLLPGKYGVRASAVLFLPASRENLRLQPDRRAVVNLTLSALFEESRWLPARAKRGDEQIDDWSWTLRSSAGRPILKLADDGSLAGQVQSEAKIAPVATRARLSTTASSKSFGRGGTRIRLQGQRVSPEGTQISLDSSIGASVSGGEGAFPIEVSTSMERPLGLAGMIANTIDYESHPEITSGGIGLQGMSLGSVESFSLGDFANIQAGDRVQVVTGGASTIVNHPFLRVDAHTGDRWTVSYSLATAVDAQDYDSVLRHKSDLPTTAYVDGRMETESGLHQEISVSRRTKASLIAVAYYADALDWVSLSGGLDGGSEGFHAVQHEGFPDRSNLVDQSNGAFRSLARGNSSSGINVLLTRTLRPGVWVALQYSSGGGLAISGAPVDAGGGLMPQTQGRRAQAATIYGRASAAKTGTKIRASYRWQPAMLVTSVAPFDMVSGGNYLCVHLRQPLTLAKVLPEGMELTVDGENMLGQGYRHFQSRSGEPLFLASSPRNLQAGLAFNF